MRGDLQRLTWEMSRRETRTYDRTATGFKMTSEMQKGDWVNSVLKGTGGKLCLQRPRCRADQRRNQCGDQSHAVADGFPQAEERR